VRVMVCPNLRLILRAGSRTQVGLSEFRAESSRKMKISGAQIKAARDLLKITQAELAESTGIAERTVQKFEGDGMLEPGNVEKIVAELEGRGIEFTNGERPPSSDPGIGVRLNLTKAATYAQKAGQKRKQP